MLNRAGNLDRAVTVKKNTTQISGQASLQECTVVRIMFTGIVQQVLAGMGWDFLQEVGVSGGVRSITVRAGLAGR